MRLKDFDRNISPFSRIQRSAMDILHAFQACTEKPLDYVPGGTLLGNARTGIHFHTSTIEIE